MVGDSTRRPHLADCLPRLLSALANTADPDRVLVDFERLVQGVVDAAALCRAMADEPRLLDMLVTLFSGSQFLSEIVLRDPEYLSLLEDPWHLAEPKDTVQLYAEAEAATAPFLREGQGAQPNLPLLGALRRFQRWELLRIGACDLVGLLDLPMVTAQLSHLADSLIRLSLARAAEQTGTGVEGLVVLALGKLGGGELNYSSDIDLVFLAASDPAPYVRLCERLVDMLARVTDEGFLYRVDLRLRPWGEVGPLVSSLEGFMAYLGQHARLWEKQALLKARAVAGDAALGELFLVQSAALVFPLNGGQAEVDLRAAVREMKERIEADLSRRGHEWGEVKLGKGSIRDVEFVTQYLQLRHGAGHPDVRSANTLDALARLWAAGLLGGDEYRVLVDGYAFLRPVEHCLQMMHNQQTHTLPSDKRELHYLARRLGFHGADARAEFLERYQQHTAAIRAVYQQHLERRPVDVAVHLMPGPTDVRRHVARMAPSYRAVFSDEEIRRHAELAERLGAENLVEVDAVPLADGFWRVTVVAYDYPGELSLICGLLFAYGLSIRDGHVFTYEPLEEGSRTPSASPSAAQRSRAHGEDRRKIVDVFNVSSVTDEVSADTWSCYANDLAALLGDLQAGEQPEAHGKLAQRVAQALREIAGTTTPTLHPIDIEIDNEASDRYTVLYIDAPDTIGFLYEFSNALALSNVYIARVDVDSVGNRVHDALYLTDANGHKITSPERQRELRAATVLVKHFTHLLPHSPNPESALLHFSEFLGQLFMRPDWPDELASLERPEVLSALARLLGVSDFLWDDFLRMQHANLFPVVRDVDALGTAKTRKQLEAELDAALRAAPDGAVRRSVLNAFKDREMFRADMRHIQGHVRDFRQFSGELTELSEVVVNAAYRLCDEELREQFGEPRCEDGRPCPLAVCALGKCGGRELGFASDIELMFVFAGNGETAGPTVTSTAEFFEQVVVRFLDAVHAKREGIFQVDLQLRPYGNAGSLAVSLQSFQRYFAPGGPAWPYERQALIKLRPIGGDAALGARLVALRNEFVYSGAGFDAAAMRAMRERQLRHLVTPGTINAKFSPGGLVDVEYLVQGLQMRYGHRDATLRTTNTGEAIEALALAGVLASEDHARLRDAHVWLRNIIDALRMVRGNAKDLTIPPADSEDLTFLARRLGYEGDLARLRGDLARHTEYVRALSARLLA
jgi:glutamate-ammonia-ligase adenylyltransferase